ncbi:peroxisomal biogenesis factor 11 family protein [Iris pallida]|uniref:Peroxisomal biogenesis factor 11 family protein n=1 Tax=Iris pallida TaxID=29817 RepID=A0AAX6GIN4_IRIPA|nr:peroxisomal biogenesis factor 11 family protein [Iris pallida]
MVTDWVRLDIRQSNHQIRDVCRHCHQPHHPIPPYLRQPLLLAFLLALLSFFRPPLLCQPLSNRDKIQRNEEDVAQCLPERRDKAHLPGQALLYHSNPCQPKEVVEEEVHHLAPIGEHGKGAAEWSRAGAPSEGIETSEEASGAEGLAAQPGGHLPQLGSPGNVSVCSFHMPVGELRDILEGLDELVNAIALGEEDDELVNYIVAHGSKYRLV